MGAVIWMVFSHAPQSLFPDPELLSRRTLVVRPLQKRKHALTLCCCDQSMPHILPAVTDVIRVGADCVLGGCFKQLNGQHLSVGTTGRDKLGQAVLKVLCIMPLPLYLV